MIDLTPTRHRTPRNRFHDRRATVTAALPWKIADMLDDAVERLGTNKSKLVCAALEVGIPLVEAQVKAASQPDAVKE